MTQRPTPCDIADLRDSLTSSLRAVERTADELFSEPDLFDIAYRITGELDALVDAAQPAISLPRRPRP